MINLLVNISMQCRRFGHQVDKIPISQFGGRPFKHLFWESCSKTQTYEQKVQNDHELEF